MFPNELLAKIGSNLDYKNFLVLIASSKSIYVQKEKITQTRNILRIYKLTEMSQAYMHLLLAVKQKDFELLKIYIKLIVRKSLKLPELGFVKIILETCPKELLYYIQNIILETPVDQLDKNSLDICFRAALVSGNINVVKMLKPQIQTSGNFCEIYKDELEWSGKHATVNFLDCFDPPIEECLINAVSANNFELVKHILTIQSKHDHHFIHLFSKSIENNNIKMFELLFDNSDKTIGKRMAIFDCAVRNNNKLFVEYLLQNLLFTEKKCISMALRCAVDENNIELTELFLTYPDIKTDTINDALQNTTNANIIRILLKDNRVNDSMILAMILDDKMPSIIIDELACL
jgi:hypothetical protein